MYQLINTWQKIIFRIVTSFVSVLRKEDKMKITQLSTHSINDSTNQSQHNKVQNGQCVCDIVNFKGYHFIKFDTPELARQALPEVKRFLMTTNVALEENLPLKGIWLKNTVKVELKPERFGNQLIEDTYLCITTPEERTYPGKYWAIPKSGGDPIPTPTPGYSCYCDAPWANVPKNDKRLLSELQPLDRTIIDYLERTFSSSIEYFISNFMKRLDPYCQNAMYLYVPPKEIQKAQEAAARFELVRAADMLAHPEKYDAKRLRERFHNGCT